MERDERFIENGEGITFVPETDEEKLEERRKQLEKAIEQVSKG